MAVRRNELVIFDTDFLSEWIRQKPEAISFYKGVPHERKRTTIINKIELLQGRFQQIQTADNEERLIRAQLLLDRTDGFLSDLPAILPIDEEAARHYFQLNRKLGLKKFGRRDLLIAAIAIRHSCLLVTGNTRHFVSIPNLRLVDWRDV